MESFEIKSNKGESRLPIGKCERCKKKGHLAHFMGHAVCSEKCYNELKWKRKCRVKSARRERYGRANPYKKFDDELFGNSHK